MSKKREIFIISSAEADTYVSRLRQYIDEYLYDEGIDDFHCSDWQYLFQRSRDNLPDCIWNTLIAQANNIRQTNGYAIVFATFDDQAIIRSKYFRTIRDNVLLEYGLFCGIVGNDHTFFICDSKDYDKAPDHHEKIITRLPSDMAGRCGKRLLKIKKTDDGIKLAAQDIVQYIRRNDRYLTADIGGHNDPDYRIAYSRDSQSVTNSPSNNGDKYYESNE